MDESTWCTLGLTGWLVSTSLKYVSEECACAATREEVEKLRCWVAVDFCCFFA